MGALAEAGRHTSIPSVEREGALAAIASAREDVVYSVVAIRPRRPWRGETSRCIELLPHTGGDSRELDRAIDLARQRYPLDKIWEVIGARAIATHDDHGGDWPEEWQLLTDIDVLAEFRLMLF